MAWTNADGLTILSGGEQGETNDKGNTINSDDSQLVAHVDLVDLPLTPVSFDSFIPKGSFITDAYVVVEEAAAGGTSITLGLYEKDGTVIDADGLNGAVLLADLDADNAVVLSGDLVRGTATVGAEDAYLGITAAGTFTAGKIKVCVYFIPA